MLLPFHIGQPALSKVFPFLGEFSAKKELQLMSEV